MLNVDTLTFDLTDCELVSQSETERIWVHSEYVAYRLKLDEEFDAESLSSQRRRVIMDKFNFRMTI